MRNKTSLKPDRFGRRGKRRRGTARLFVLGAAFIASTAAGRLAPELHAQSPARGAGAQVVPTSRFDIAAGPVAASTTSAANLYSGINLTLVVLHAWNMIGAAEDFEKVRGSVLVGVGGTYARGYIGALVRGGYEWRLGKHSAFSVFGGQWLQGREYGLQGSEVC